MLKVDESVSHWMKKKCKGLKQVLLQQNIILLLNIYIIVIEGSNNNQQFVK